MRNLYATRIDYNVGLVICTVSRTITLVMITVFNEIHLQLSSDTLRIEEKKYTPSKLLNKKKNADITIAWDHTLSFISCLMSLTGRGHHTFRDFFFLALRWRAVSGLLTNYHALFFALSLTLFRLFHEDRRNKDDIPRMISFLVTFSYTLPINSQMLLYLK